MLVFWGASQKPGLGSDYFVAQPDSYSLWESSELVEGSASSSSGMNSRSKHTVYRIERQKYVAVQSKKQSRSCNTGAVYAPHLWASFQLKKLAWRSHLTISSQTFKLSSFSLITQVSASDISDYLESTRSACSGWLAFCTLLHLLIKVVRSMMAFEFRSVFQGTRNAVMHNCRSN